MAKHDKAGRQNHLDDWRDFVLRRSPAELIEACLAEATRIVLEYEAGLPPLSPPDFLGPPADLSAMEKESPVLAAHLMLDYAQTLKSRIEIDDEEGALMLAFGVGLLSQKMGFGDDVLRGRKVLDGAKRAHEQTHGDPQEKAERWRQLADAFHAIYPAKIKKKCGAYNKVAAMFGASVSSVQRALAREKKSLVSARH